MMRLESGRTYQAPRLSTGTEIASGGDSGIQLLKDRAQRILLNLVVLLLPIIVVALLLTTSNRVIPNALLLLGLLLLAFYIRRQRRLSPWYERYGWKVVTFMIIFGAVAGFLADPTPGTFLIYLSLILAATSMFVWGRKRRRAEVKEPESELQASGGSEAKRQT